MIDILLVAFGKATYPIGLADIHHYLRTKGYQSEFIHLYDDFNRLNTVKLIPKYVGITCFTHMRGELDAVINLVRNKWPNTKVVLGGRHFVNDTLPLEQKLFSKVQHVILGEGEYALAALLEGSVSDKIIYGTKLTQQDYTALDLPNTKFIKENFAACNMTSLLFSRGCPYNCVFCCDKRIPIIRKSPQAAAYYIKYLKDTRNIRAVHIYDDIFTTSKSWLNAFRQHLDTLRVKMNFHCFIHGRHFDKEILELLLAIGVTKVELGAESGDNDILKLLNKKTTIADYYKIHELTKPYNKLSLHCMWMLGNIGETNKTMGKTIELAKKIGTDKPWFSFAVPFPGTTFWKEAEKYGKIITYDFSKWWNESLIFVPNGVTIEEMHRWRKVGQNI